MLLEVTHTTHFSYVEDVIESTMEARLAPRTDRDQRTLSFELVIQPNTRLLSYRDGFANTVHCFTVLPPHDSLVLTARSRVETLLTNPFAPLERVDVYDQIACWPYLQLGGPVLAGDEVTMLAARFRPADSERALESLQDLMHFIYQTFDYESEVTTVSSTVNDLLVLRKGVCQDFAHLMIAVCRAMGVPARYVSGYILTSPERAARGGGASHAWCEAWLPQYGWRGFDPTNAVLAADGHVKVGLGRDYGDVPPTRGVYRGMAEEHIEVQVETLRLDRAGS